MKDWPKWLIGKNLEKYNYASFVGYQDGYFTVILETFDETSNHQKIKITWEKIYSYMVTNESYREDVWIDGGDEYWPFYKFEDSPFISTFKSVNAIYRENPINHFLIVGEEVVDILTGKEPIITILNNQDEVIKEFSEINSGYINGINGQSRFGYYLSEYEDFYEIPNIIDSYGTYKGSFIKFYDFETGDVFTPFELKENIQYASPIFLDNNYYFLQADFTDNLVTIYKYYPRVCLQPVEQFKMAELNLYNLGLMGENLHLVSHDNEIDIHYPYKKSIPLESNESAMFIQDGKIFISAWVEEGWDSENDIAGPNYEYYDKIIIKDMNGKTISERRGNLFQHIDGTWRLS